ncbi:MAG: YdeI/OmpD-associated family protein [Chthoniobacterales bacterium]|nr:YdeI/OmpD-associated family protein [Chthoniobacterales bacterium]
MIWLEKNHDSSSEVWLRFAKKASGLKSVSYQEALDVALCYGWIDGQAKKGDGEEYWIQKFTPRRKRSIWPKRNREKALALIESGEMRPGGLAEIERAKQDGRWAAAYDSPKKITVPSDLQAVLDKNRRAMSFFEILDSRNRYAILFRIHTAKKAETRARRIQQFVTMLAKKEKLYP